MLPLCVPVHMSLWWHKWENSVCVNHETKIHWVSHSSIYLQYAQGAWLLVSALYAETDFCATHILYELSK